MITVQFLLTRFKISRTKVFGRPESTVLFLQLGIISIGIWNRHASGELLESLRSLNHSKEWIAENWPDIRLAKRKGYKRGLAEGLTKYKGDIDYWKQCAMKNHDALIDAQHKNQALCTTITTLYSIREQAGAQ